MKPSGTRKPALHHSLGETSFDRLEMKLESETTAPGRNLALREIGNLHAIDRPSQSIE
jgi:hypothetical protein